MTFFGKIWALLQKSLMDAPITPETLRARYSAMSDSQLESINEEELTPVAIEAFRAEVAARKKKL